MTCCPKCKSPIVETFALRPEEWPNDKPYRVCTRCPWEEKNKVSLKKIKQQIKKRAEAMIARVFRDLAKNDQGFRSDPNMPE